ncbi:NAD(P)H-hydrate dehydratase [Pseudorhodoplanes sp.]|uniref:NAD(P)H-hydrate dehydratase n=1 Tax=Pseudorhodoplanes sp. TaxID=1934341 RepID=UPI003918FE4C
MYELLTNEQMRQADQLAVRAGVPSLQLMERAGRAVAECVIAMSGTRRPVVVCAGAGNNGGDGLVAARLLAERGVDIRVLTLGNIDQLRGDAGEMARRYSGPVGKWAGEEIDPHCIVVDAIFGSGLSRQVEGAVAALIAAINRSGVPIVAVDLPSGISGDTGAVLGNAVKATRTVTFFRRKPGHLLLPGRLHCGTTSVADIGIPEAVLDTIRPHLFANVPSLWGDAFPFPQIEGHKYTRGHTVVVSGGITSTGAARLAARAALRAGSGLVTIASPAEAVAVNAAATTAVMVREAEGAQGLSALLSDPRLNAVVLGPGGGVGEHTRAKVRMAARGERALVLDADALTSFGENPKELFTILTNHRLSTAILSPHEGEFVRLFSTINEIPSVKQKLEACLAASHETAAVVILKGPDTVVAAPDGRAAIANNGPPFLATAGSGDVLAGLCAGLRAQGMPAFEAAAAAVWLHGEAANVVGPGLISEDLPDALPVVYRRLFRRLDPAPGSKSQA